MAVLLLVLFGAFDDGVIVRSITTPPVIARPVGRILDDEWEYLRVLDGGF